MAYINEPYKVVYIAKNFTSGLTDVKLFVFKPDMTKLGPFTLIESSDIDAKGIYIYDFGGADVPGTYTFVTDSLTTPLKSARTMYFETPLETQQAANILDQIVEGNITIKEALQITLAVLAGKSSGGDTSNIVFRNITDTKDKVTAIVSNVGNRKSVTINNG